MAEEFCVTTSGFASVQTVKSQDTMRINVAQVLMLCFSSMCCDLGFQ